jgi:hypothetical protein
MPKKSAPSMQLRIWLPAEMHRAVKARAADKQVTMSEAVVDLLQRITSGNSSAQTDANDPKTRALLRLVLMSLQCTSEILGRPWHADAEAMLAALGTVQLLMGATLAAKIPETDVRAKSLERLERWVEAIAGFPDLDSYLQP